MTAPSTPVIAVDTTHVSLPPSLRPSLDSRSSSRRVSLELPYMNAALSPSPGGAAVPRVPRSPGRNRSALRQFYGLAALETKAEEEGGGGEGRVLAAAAAAEIDREGFDAREYAEGLLEREGMRELLGVENGLVNEIRGFDGERKALVYDNYSKLITATDTIRKMRANMEPLTPTTSTLEPAIAHIAQVSASLIGSIPRSPLSTTTTAAAADAPLHNAKKKNTVKWVLEGPERVRRLVEEGKKEEAEKEWGVVLGILERWKGVKGVEEVRKKGEEALAVAVKS